MSNIWKWVSAFLAGFATMAIIALKWFNGDDYSVEVAKIKNKRTSGVTSTVIPISLDVAEKARKRASKEESKEDKKAKRQARRAKRKANK